MIARVEITDEQADTWREAARLVLQAVPPQADVLFSMVASDLARRSHQLLVQYEMPGEAPAPPPIPGGGWV